VTDEQAVLVNEDLSRFELEVEGHTAYITFTRDGGSMTLKHTEVPSELEGRGVGSRLVRGALDYVERNGLGLVPQCPFVRSYLQRHPDDAARFGIDPASL
jgi:hypothetical protein